MIYILAMSRAGTASSGMDSRVISTYNRSPNNEYATIRQKRPIHVSIQFTSALKGDRERETGLVYIQYIVNECYC